MAIFRLSRHYCVKLNTTINGRDYHQYIGSVRVQKCLIQNTYYVNLYNLALFSMNKYLPIFPPLNYSPISFHSNFVLISSLFYPNFIQILTKILTNQFQKITFLWERAPVRHYSILRSTQVSYKPKKVIALNPYLKLNNRRCYNPLFK
jgi:hypothetical protein